MREEVAPAELLLSLLLDNMKYAIVKNGVVENIIIATPIFIQESGLTGVEIPENSGVGIGDSYVDGLFAGGEKYVPDTVKSHLLRKYLRVKGHVDILGFATSLSLDLKDEWEYSPTKIKTSALILLMKSFFNISDKELNEIFVLASSES